MVRLGEQVNHLVFVMSGVMTVHDKDGNAQIDLFEGSCAGEVSALLGIPSPHSVQVR